MAVLTRTYLCLARLSCLSSFRSFTSTMCSTNSEWPRGIKDGGESYRLAKNPCTTDSFKTKTTPGWVTDICPLFSKCFSALSFSPFTLHRKEFMNLTNSFLALFESPPRRMSTLLPPSTRAHSPGLKPFGLRAVFSSLPTTSPHPMDLSLHLASQQFPVLPQPSCF